jgi:cob(I)alamin adenosyltransferase
MKIYTKTGDKGKTKLVDGTSVDKFHPRVDAYGCVDELNSCLGLARSFLKDQPDISGLDAKIEIIQNQLFSVGSLLATESTDVFAKLPQIKNSHIEQLEKWIDQHTEGLPELRNFILPAGHAAAAQLHIARTVCRRAERKASVIIQNEEHYSDVLVYLNRLSDLLFTWSRWVNFKLNIPDTLWKKENV